MTTEVMTMFWKKWFRKKLAHPVVSSESHTNDVWPNYEGDREYGPLFFIRWPVTHPDSDCELGKYTPGDDGLCGGCFWTPAEQVCCDTFKNPVRRLLELDTLSARAERNNFLEIVPIYLAYVDEFGDRLDGAPDFIAMQEWFSELSKEQQLTVMSASAGLASAGVTVISVSIKTN